MIVMLAKNVPLIFSQGKVVVNMADFVYRRLLEGFSSGCDFGYESGSESTGGSFYILILCHVKR